MQLKFSAGQFAIGLLMLLFLSGCMSQAITPTEILEITSTPTVTEPVPPAITFIPTKNLTPEPISPEAEAYLNEFLVIFLENTINQNDLNPERVRVDAYGQAAGAQTPADTYDAIRYIFTNYGDHHSGFMTPEEADQIEYSTTKDYPTPTGEMIDGIIGYMFLGGFTGSLEQMEIHANDIRQVLTDLDAQAPCGWIVDLSHETGGEMYSAIAGLGPLIGEGQVGAFLYPDGTKEYWYYLNGEAGIDDTPVIKVSNPAFVLQAPDAPVAVLINRQTVSAGEAIAVAFHGRPNTRFFGRQTAGYTTGNAGIPMSDGAMLIITRSTYVDRTGQVYGGKIVPDEQAYTEIIDNKVKDWLLSQPACSNP
jgi:carboxyl-terminal processing protease